MQQCAGELRADHVRGGEFAVDVFKLEGLDHVVVGAGFQRLHRATYFRIGGDDHHQRVIVGLSQLAQYVESVGIGQPDVEQDQLETLPGEDVQRLFAGGCPCNTVAPPFEDVAECFANRFVVIDDQDVLRQGCSPVGLCG